MRVLLDTNILARIAQPGHFHHLAALNAVNTLRRQGDELFLVPQVLYEFWVICTRPIEQNGLGLQVSFAAEKHNQSKALFTLLPDTDAIFPAWEKLVSDLEIKGKQAHDARLIAAMKVHSIQSVLTFNTTDLSRYPDVTLIDPLNVSHGSGK